MIPINLCTLPLQIVAVVSFILSISIVMTGADVEWETSGWKKEGRPIPSQLAGEEIHLGLTGHRRPVEGYRPSESKRPP